MSESKWLMWIWQHFQLYVYEYDSLEDAVKAAEAIEDAGNGSTAGFETPDGQKVDEQTVEAVWSEVRKERDAAWDREFANRKNKTRHHVEVKSPFAADFDSDRWAHVESYANKREAERHADRLSKSRPNRVRVRTTTP